MVSCLNHLAECLEVLISFLVISLLVLERGVMILYAGQTHVYSRRKVVVEWKVGRRFQ